MPAYLLLERGGSILGRNQNFRVFASLAQMRRVSLENIRADF
jgi:hypothetical protein